MDVVGLPLRNYSVTVLNPDIDQDHPLNLLGANDIFSRPSLFLFSKYFDFSVKKITFSVKNLTYRPIKSKLIFLVDCWKSSLF